MIKIIKNIMINALTIVKIGVIQYNNIIENLRKKLKPFLKAKPKRATINISSTPLHFLRAFILFATKPLERKPPNG